MTTIPTTYRVPLGEGVEVEVRFSGATRKEHFVVLRKWVDLLEGGLVERETARPDDECAHCRRLLRFEEEISSTLCAVCVYERRFLAANGQLLDRYLRAYGLERGDDESDEEAHVRLEGEEAKVASKSGSATPRVFEQLVLERAKKTP